MQNDTQFSKANRNHYFVAWILANLSSTVLDEVAASIVLAGELSIILALCSVDNVSAHRSLSRGEPQFRK